MQKFFYILLLGVLISACTKEPLPELPQANDPFYTLRGSIGDEDIDLVVGDDGVSITQGKEIMNGVETFYGELRAPSSDLIFRVEVLEPEHYSQDTEILGGEIDFIHHEEGCLSVNFGSITSQLNFLLIENVDGDMVPASFMAYEEYGLYEATLQFADYGLETFTIPVSYGFDRSSIDAGFTAGGTADSVLLVPNTIEGSHKWYVNDKLISEEANYNGQIGNGIHKVTHEVEVDGKTSAYSTLIRFRSGIFYWQMEYDYCDDSTPKQNFGKVKLSVQKDGIWYYSDTQNSSADEFFSAENITYVVDQNLNPLYAYFDLQLKAKLFTRDLSLEMDLSNLEGTFNIGLK